MSLHSMMFLAGCVAAIVNTAASSPSSTLVMPTQSIWDDIQQIRAETNATDYKCVNDCTAQHYQYQFCVEKCSYSTKLPSLPPPGHGVDYKCVNDCTQKGYLYNYCRNRCTF